MCDMITKEKELQIQQPIQIQQQNAVEQNQMAEQLQQKVQQQVAEPLVQNMEIHAEIDTPAPPL